MKFSLAIVSACLTSVPFICGNNMFIDTQDSEAIVTCTIERFECKNAEGTFSSFHVCRQENGMGIALKNGDNVIDDEEVQILTVKKSSLVGGKFDASLDLSVLEAHDFKMARSFRADTPTMGTFTAVVVVVVGSDGVKPVDNAQDYAKHVFTNESNMARQFKDCSGGRTIINPGTGPLLENGAIDLILDEPLRGVDINTAENMATSALADKGMISTYRSTKNPGSSRTVKEYDFFLFMWGTANPDAAVHGNDGTKPFGGAHAMMPGWLSSYSEGAGRHTTFLQHEVGHNFRQNHSTLRQNEYGDGTCIMGGGDNFQDQLMCFNGAKSWYLGYYEDKHIEIIPTASSADVVMVSFNDYNNGEVTENGQYTVAKISGDAATPLYMVYNRAEEMMIDSEQPDMIVIVEQKDDKKGQPQKSKLLGNIDEGEEYTKSNWNGGDKSLTIKVCTKVNGAPDYARVQVYLEGSELDCGGSPITVPPPAPTSVPTSAPLSAYEEITSETCEAHSLKTIETDDECNTAAQTIGIRFPKGVNDSGYSDVVDGCSVRYRYLRKSEVYLNQDGRCDPSNGSALSTNCKCAEQQVCICRRELGPTSPTSQSPISTPTKSPVTSPGSSVSLRIWASANMLEKKIWEVADLNFYSSPACTGTNHNYGTPISSGYKKNLPSYAFDTDMNTVWGDKDDNGEALWLGMQYDNYVEIACVSFLDIDTKGVTAVEVQILRAGSRNWETILVVDAHIPGQREDIPLSLVSPTTSPFSPTLSPVNPTSSPVTPTTSPTTEPTTAGDCTEGKWAKWLFKMKKDGSVKPQDCNWLSSQKAKKIVKFCRSKNKCNEEYGTPRKVCPVTCNTCGNDDGDAKFVFKVKKNGNGAKYKTCNWLAKKTNPAKICKKKTASFEDIGPPAEVCPVTCTTC